MYALLHHFGKPFIYSFCTCCNLCAFLRYAACLHVACDIADLAVRVHVKSAPLQYVCMFLVT